MCSCSCHGPKDLDDLGPPDPTPEALTIEMLAGARGQPRTVPVTDGSGRGIGGAEILGDGRAKVTITDQEMVARLKAMQHAGLDGSFDVVFGQESARALPRPARPADGR